MKSQRNTRAWLFTALIVLLGVSALPTKADPAGGWVEYRTNFYGYGGDFIDIARFDFGFRYWASTSRFPIAVAKTYIVRSKSGIGNPIQITSVDQVQESLAYDGSTWPLSARATSDDTPALLSDSKYRSSKGWAVFLAAQPIFVCNDTTTIPGTVSVTGGSSTHTDNSTADSLLQMTVCANGSFPVYVSAAFAHGIYGGP